VDAAGVYKDSAEFTVVRPITQRYNAACSRRIAAQLRAGEYLLDAASGPVHALNVPLSENYRFRICLNFSIRALREAKKTLPPGRGLFVLGDDVISLHMLYHLPPARPKPSTGLSR
jgi:hypothetical protein